jgi:transposase
VCKLALLANAIGQLGHTIRMMPPTYVKAYVKRNKTDACRGDLRSSIAAATSPQIAANPAILFIDY